MAIDWTSNTWGDKMSVVGFGILDAKGREVGAVLKVAPQKDGRVLTYVQAARNGRKYGAHHGGQWADSVDAGMAMAEDKAQQVRARVVKDAAKTGGVYLTASERKARPVKAPEPAHRSALDMYHSLLEEASRRTQAVRELPVGSQERKTALEVLARWRNEVMRPTDAMLWAQVVAEGGGVGVVMPAPKSCPNAECRGGFVGGEDPHACGDC